MYDEHCDLICLDAPRAETIRAVLPDLTYAGWLADRISTDGERPWRFFNVTRLVLALALLEGEELCVCDLSWVTGRTQDYVTHHLHTLRSEGLVVSRREGELVMYSLTEEAAGFLRSALERHTDMHTEGS